MFPSSRDHIATAHRATSLGLDRLARRSVSLVLLAGCILLAVCRPVPSAAQAFSVGVRLDFATGSGPVSVRIGDLNGDDEPDLVTANPGVNTISVLARGQGRWLQRQDGLRDREPPFSVAIADVNGDGKADVAVANGGSKHRLDPVRERRGRPGAQDGLPS